MVFAKITRLKTNILTNQVAIKDGFLIKLMSFWRLG